MIRPKRTAQLLAVSAVAALVLSSCGGSDDSSDDNNAGGENTSPTEETSAAPTGDGTLTIGSFLPQTGDLAYLGPPEFAGVDLAVQEINDAGGVLGQPVKQAKGDSGDLTPDIGGEQVDKLLNADSDVILGAASSSVSLSVIDKIIGANKVMFSPANTSPAFDTYDDKDLYFRTSPSDVFQGEVLANLMVEDNLNNVAILARQDSYGEGLSKRLKEVLEEKGATVAAYELYSADATNYTAEVNKIAASKPDSIAVIGFEETTKIVPQLIAKQVGPQDIPTYFVDGNTADYSDEDVRPPGREGDLPGGCRGPGRLQQEAGRDLGPEEAQGLHLRCPVLRRRDADRAGGGGSQGRRRPRTVEAHHRRLRGRHGLHGVRRVPRPAQAG